MSDVDDTPSPFARPGFIAGAVVVALLLVVGIVLAVVTATRGTDTPPPVTTSSSSSSVETPSPSSSSATADSVCGLSGTELTGTVTTPPKAEWAYFGTVGYPRSAEYGSAASAAAGFPYCYQHSAEGALFMAATALAVPSDTTLARPWLEYSLSDGTFRDTILASSIASDSTGVRLQLVGFRVLAYDGRTARIDLAVRGSSNGTTITGSYVYNLIWQDGDWKFDADIAAPFDFATIPDTSGYVPWGA